MRATLAKYHAKREFSKTAEPSGDTSRNAAQDRLLKTTGRGRQSGRASRTQERHAGVAASARYLSWLQS